MPTALCDAANKILPALVTPLTSDGALDSASAERLIDHLYNQGVGGLYVTGSTGEGVFLDFDTRRRMVELSVAASRGRGQVIAHVGATQAAQAYELAAHAAAAGADAVASIPPFMGGYSWSEILRYYQKLCEAGPLPVLAYCIPSLTGQNFSLEQLTQFVRMPKVGGLKFTDNNMSMIDRLLNRMRADQVIYNGADQMLSLGMMYGAHGGIGTTYNFVPREVVAIHDHVRAGRLAEALVVQKQVNAVIEVILEHATLAVTKQILVWQGWIECAQCAEPREGISPENQEKLRRRLMETVVGPTLVR